jgi:hypothetical protein
MTLVLQDGLVEPIEQARRSTNPGRTGGRLNLVRMSTGSGGRGFQSVALAGPDFGRVGGPLAFAGARFTRLPWGKASVDSLTVGGEIDSSGQAKIQRAERRREAARRVGWSGRVVILQVVRGVA